MKDNELIIRHIDSALTLVKGFWENEHDLKKKESYMDRINGLLDERLVHMKDLIEHNNLVDNANKMP